MSKIWTIIKNFIASIKARNMKDIAIAVLIFSLVIVGWRTLYLWQKNQKQKAAIEQGEKTKTENLQIINGLNSFIKKLAGDVVARDKTIIERNIIIAEKEQAKKKAEQDAINLKNDLKKSSQEEQDKMLEALLEENKIEARVVAVKNYMEIKSDARLKLSNLVIDYGTLFTKNKENEGTIIPQLKLNIADLQKNEDDLKISIIAINEKCSKEKENLNIDLTNVTNSRDTWKKKAFWSKVGGVVAVILTILLMK